MLIVKREYTKGTGDPTYDTTGAVRYWLPERDAGVRIYKCDDCEAMYWKPTMTCTHVCACS